MDTITNAPRYFRLYGAVLAMAALLIALLAVTITAGPTMAQTDPNPNPPPCGPGQANVPDNPAETVSSGHYAVFDGYWYSGTKTLNLNLCPPSVMHKEQGGGFGQEPVEVSIRTASNVDIRRTVFNIDGHDFAHTLTAADVEKYDFFELDEDKDGNGVDDAIGQTVWWLKVDDPSTPNEDEDSALAMGFSAALFDPQYWYLDDGDEDRNDEGAEPLQYEFEVIREPGIPIPEQGHVFAFDDSPAPTEGDSANIKTAYWDSSEVDANALPLYPGEYHHLQWAFTKPGTYVISVQLKGHVRHEQTPLPDGEEYPGDWEPISRDRTVTSEVGRYVFQVGRPLTLNHEPVFGVERSVDENSAAGTPVGAPIPVHQGDDDDLTFTLTGTGHSLFSVEADAEGNAQIKVADGAVLNHEDTSSYVLNLSVSDNKDHESNPDASVDSVIWVTINVVDDPDEQLSITLTADPPATRQTVGNQVVLTGTVTGSPVATSRLKYGWGVEDQGGGNAGSGTLDSPSWTVTDDRDRAVTREYRMRVWADGVTHVESNRIVIHWQARQ